jgi:shikimate dehydrogenase
MENIILIGMPGCGKTSVAALLAQRTGKEWVDADEQIVKAAGMSIPEIFARGGEEAFRKLETEVLAQLGKRSGIILSTGGGCVTRQENYPLLHQNGTVFWLQRDIGSLPTEGRPISQRTALNTLYEIRKPLYEAFADQVIENNGTLEDAADQILGRSL